jgi:hypothetical protein
LLARRTQVLLGEKLIGADGKTFIKVEEHAYLTTCAFRNRIDAGSEI